MTRDRKLHDRAGRDHTPDAHLFSGAAGVSPEINAISTLLIAGVAALVVTASLILKREKLMA